MPPPHSRQLEFCFPNDGKASLSRFVLSRPIFEHRYSGKLLERLNYVIRFFPEFQGEVIKVGFTRAASGMAVPGGNEIWFNSASPSYHTISHEFVHLLQGRGDIPQGERSCDVFSLARHWTLNDTLPTYVKIPGSFHDVSGRIPGPKAKLIYTVATRAVESRRSGLRNYIASFERELAEIEAYGHPSSSRAEARSERIPTRAGISRRPRCRRA